MTQEELRAEAKQVKLEVTKRLHYAFCLPGLCTPTVVAEIVDLIVYASVAETLAELEERKEQE